LHVTDGLKVLTKEENLLKGKQRG
ncbi:hypothetical protein LCGC14_3156510, partial [marine sediment metagenome]